MGSKVVVVLEAKDFDSGGDDVCRQVVGGITSNCFWGGHSIGMLQNRTTPDNLNSQHSSDVVDPPQLASSADPNTSPPLGQRGVDVTIPRRLAARASC